MNTSFIYKYNNSFMVSGNEPKIEAASPLFLKRILISLKWLTVCIAIFRAVSLMISRYSKL